MFNRGKTILRRKEVTREWRMFSQTTLREVKKKKNPCDRAFMKLMLPRGLEMIESVALDWVYFLYHLNIKWHKEIWIAAHISREISNSSDRSSSRGKRVTGGKETYMSGDSGNQKNPVSSLWLEVLKPLKGFLPFPLFRVLQF